MFPIQPQKCTPDKTDLTQGGWIDRLLPSAVRTYAYLMRLDRPIGTWLLLLPGWWGILLAYPQHPDLMKIAFLFGLFAGGAVIMRGAGCVINDLWDRDFDGKVARTRTRPLPAGLVRPHQALLFAVFLGGLGFLILITLNPATILLGFLSVPLIIAYPLMKRITWWPQAFLGLTFNFGALMGYSAMTGTIALPAVLLYIAGIFWTLGYDTIYAHMDRADDALIGVKSTARLFGPARSRQMVALFYILATVFVALALAAAQGFVAALLGALVIGAGFYFQLRVFNPEDEASCLRLFKQNRAQGGLILLAVLIGLLI